VHGQLDRATDHHRGELGVGCGGLGLADDLAETDDGDAVGDRAHLAQLVRDEHDRRALVAQLRMIAISSSVSCGVSTAVGSSKTSTFASRESALMISTRCCTPTGRSPTRASGSTSNPKRAATSRTCARGGEVEEPRRRSARGRA
jgi:hypothetical protein